MLGACPQVKDKDMMTRDDLVGQCSITPDMMTAMCISRVSTTESLELSNPMKGSEPIKGHSGRVSTVQFTWSAKPK
jgi:hypothetical protein